MCGILGYISKEESQYKIDLEQWANTLFHRGPDEFGGFSDEGVGLGMRRLSIIDVANGHQPIFNEQQTVIAIFNGQIYNYEALAHELIAKGHVLNSKSDGEVIVHLYEEYGETFVSRLDGMFSIALHDTVTKKLYLFRDRIGKKPMVYFHDQNGNLFFASELKSLLKIFPKSKEDISPKSLGMFLELGYVPAPFTIFEQFRKLPPASFLTWEEGAVTITKYWKPAIVINKLSLEENKEKLRLLLRTAVEKRLMSERPLGAFLSGGIDSSLIVAFMSELSANPVKTFSVGFDHAKFDESTYALEVAQRYGTEHTQITLNDGEILEGFLESFEYYDEPFADSSSLATFLLSKKTSQSVTVALSGDGGDESFGGYERYVILKKYSKYLPLIYFLKVTAKLKVLPFFLLPTRVTRVINATPRSPSIAGMYEAMMSISGYRLRSKMFKHEFREIPGSSHTWFKKEFQSPRGVSSTSKANLYDVSTYLPDDLMYKVDIASMAHSLEVRAPFLDPNLLEFGLSLPENQRVGKIGKLLLRELAYEYLPAQLIDRPKMGFGIPRAEWLAGSLSSLTSEIIRSPNSVIYDWLDFKSVNKIYDEFESGAPLEGTIWSLVNFELWAKEWLEAKSSS